MYKRQDFVDSACPAIIQDPLDQDSAEVISASSPLAPTISIRSVHGGGAHWLEAEDPLAQGTFDRRVVDIGPLAPQAGPGFAGGLAVYAIERGSPAGKAWAAGSLMPGTKRTATHLSTGVLSQGTGRPSPGERAA